MDRYTRKLVTIICEADLEHALSDDLMRLGVHGYTVTDARGRGHHGVREASWSHSSNIRIEVVCDEKVAVLIAEHLKECYYRNFAMILFMSDVEVLRPEKF